MIGGGRFDYEKNYASISAVDFYSIRHDSWSAGPDLNEARVNHSCCVHGDKIYAFCGDDLEDKYYPRKPLSSVEVLNMKAISHGW